MEHYPAIIPNKRYNNSELWIAGGLIAGTPLRGDERQLRVVTGELVHEYQYVPNHLTWITTSSFTGAARWISIL